MSAGATWSRFSKRYEDVLPPRPRRPPSLASARQPLAEPGLSRDDLRRSRCSEESTFCEECEEEEEFDTASSDDERVREESSFNSGPNKRRKTAPPPPHRAASSASTLARVRSEASLNDSCSQAMSGASSETQLDGLRELSVTAIRSCSAPARPTSFVDDARRSNEECV